VHEIAHRLGITPERALRHMLRVWIWVDQQSRDGHALCVTDVTLDCIARRDGLASAMRNARLLTGDSGNVSFPNFERHNGETAKKRALAADRQRKSRDNLSSRSDHSAPDRSCLLYRHAVCGDCHAELIGICGKPYRYRATEVIPLASHRHGIIVGKRPVLPAVQLNFGPDAKPPYRQSPSAFAVLSGSVRKMVKV
jgi:hypothetical protein